MNTIEELLAPVTSAATDYEQKLRDWLCAKNPKAKGIGLDVNIIENRIIDSLQFITFLVYIEELLGRKLRSDEVEEDSFRSIRIILDTFFS